MSTSTSPQVVLGTAQFGMPYGVSNKNPVPDRQALEAIFQTFHDLGGRLIDTSPVYGHAEKAVGEVLADFPDIGTITKTVPLPSNDVRNDDVDYVEQHFHQSLSELHVSSVYALLVHETSDLLQANSDKLFDRLDRIKQAGLAQRIGVTVSSPSQIDPIVSRFPIEIIQAPSNILDQRWHQSGILHDLKNRGIEIHLRSAFLQGAIIMPTDRLPPALAHGKTYFKNVRDHAEKTGLNPMQLALGYLKGLEDASYIVLGISSVEELKETMSTYLRVPPVHAPDLACPDETIIEPFRWEQ